MIRVAYHQLSAWCDRAKAILRPLQPNHLTEWLKAHRWQRVPAAMIIGWSISVIGAVATRLGMPGLTWIIPATIGTFMIMWSFEFAFKLFQSGQPWAKIGTAVVAGLTISAIVGVSLVALAGAEGPETDSNNDNKYIEFPNLEDVAEAAVEGAIGALACFPFGGLPAALA